MSRELCCTSRRAWPSHLCCAAWIPWMLDNHRSSLSQGACWQLPLSTGPYASRLALQQEVLMRTLFLLDCRDDEKSCYLVRKSLWVTSNLRYSVILSSPSSRIVHAGPIGGVCVCLSVSGLTGEMRGSQATFWIGCNSQTCSGRDLNPVCDIWRYIFHEQSHPYKHSDVTGLGR